MCGTHVLKKLINTFFIHRVEFGKKMNRSRLMINISHAKL
jgi:hypothetical protein